jgi:hypothetical protein
VTVALLAFLAAVRPALKVAPVTAVIMLIGTTTHMEPLTAALYRVIEITVGSLVGVAATPLIFPARAHSAIVERVREIAELNAQLLTHYAKVLRGQPSDVPTAQTYDANRAAMAKLQTAMMEADRETASRLSLRSAPEALPRTLWRQRNDIVMIGRALAQPVAIASLTEPAAAMIDAAKSFLTQTAGLIAGGSRLIASPFPKRTSPFRRRSSRCGRKARSGPCRSTMRRGSSAWCSRSRTCMPISVIWLTDLKSEIARQTRRLRRGSGGPCPRNTRSACWRPDPNSPQEAHQACGI